MSSEKAPSQGLLRDFNPLIYCCLAACRMPGRQQALKIWNQGLPEPQNRVGFKLGKNIFDLATYKMTMKIEKSKALFFDFDGVLVDSVPIKTQGYISLFKDYDDEIVEQVIRHHKINGGISRVEKIRHAHEAIIGKPLSPQEIKAWAGQYAGLVARKVIEAPWIPGAKDFLDSCPDHIKVFVISGTPEPELKQIIEKRNMARYFDEILGSPKPKPDHIRMLLEKYRLEPERGVFIGDALTDFLAAKETGLNFLGIQGEVDFPEGTRVLSDCRPLWVTLEQISFL